MPEASRELGAAITARLHTVALGRALRCLPACASTNDEAAAWAKLGAPDGAVVIALAQSAGRGRLGRSWHSPPGENLYLSVILRPPLPPHRAPPLTLVAGVAVAAALTGLGAEVELKWPNDLLVGGRKIAGILTELSCRGTAIEHVVLGLGVNVGSRAFPGELAGRATSLALVLPAPVTIAEVAAALCDRLEGWYQRYLDQGVAPIVQAWRGFARFLGQPITVDLGAGFARGTAVDLDADGALLVREESGRLRRIIAGEIVAQP